MGNSSDAILASHHRMSTLYYLKIIYIYIQAAHLLQAPKDSIDNISTISSSCFKLNSLQLRALLENYRPAHNERQIPQDLINNVVQIAQNTADHLTQVR